jgi:hypothetical protein
MSETETHDDRIDAYQPTPERTVIRLRDHGSPEEPRSSVEVVDAQVMSAGRPKSDDATVTTLFTGDPLRATQVYNQTIQPYVKAEIEAARERKEEAEAQGDTIEYINAKEYIAELEESLIEEEA